MIDPSKFVYVSINKSEHLKDVIKNQLILHGFDEKQIIFEKPAKFANVGDYFAIYMPNTKKLTVDEVGKYEKYAYGGFEHGEFVSSNNFIFSIEIEK